MMKRVNQLFVPFLILCTIGLSQMQAQKVQFFTSSLAQLENQVKQSRTPYFLFFKVLDCDACTKMQKEAFSYPPLANYASNSYMALEVDGLDFSEGIDIATRYNVKKYPTTLIFGPDGKVRDRIEGYIDGPMMLTLLQKAVRPSDRDLSNRNLNTYSPPSSQATAKRVTENSRGGYDDPIDDRNAANRNPFDNRPNPSYNSEPNLVNSNDKGATRSEEYDYGVDKRDYLSDYLTNRTKDNLQAKNQNTTRGGSTASYDDREQLNTSYFDDRGRNAHNDAAKNGNFSYNKPQERPLATIQDRYPDYSYLDDRSRDPSYQRSQTQAQAQAQGQGQTRGDNSQAGNSVNNEPGGSFLDPIDEYRADRSGQRTRGENNYSGQPVTNLESLPDGTVLKRGPDGKWYIYDEFRGNTVDPEQSTRGGGESMRVSNSNTNAALLNNTPKTITRSVPGFAEYSPKDLTQNTFGLVIGSYISMNELQGAIKEFMEHNNSKIWVYSEKLGTKHFFKLVMGEYNGEQQAVSDALRMGASWEDIEVVNLARLR